MGLFLSPYIKLFSPTNFYTFIYFRKFVLYTSILKFDYPKDLNYTIWSSTSELNTTNENVNAI